MLTYAAASVSYRRETLHWRGIPDGDAFAFITVFSSGVHLALNSGTIGAGVVDAFLRGAPDYGARLKKFPEERASGDRDPFLVYPQIEPAGVRGVVPYSTRRPPKIERAVLSLLAGDVFEQSKMRFPLFLLSCLLTSFLK